MKRLVGFIGKILRKSDFLKNFFRRFEGKSIRIIYYHIVADKIPEYYFQNKGISFEDFKTQIEYFKKYYKFIKLSEALDKHEKGESLKGYMVVTTDDGFKENYSLIAPFLIKEGIPATFFLIEKCIDNRHLMWRNKLILIQNRLGLEQTRKLINSFAKKKELILPSASEDILDWTKRVFTMQDKEILTDELWNESGLEPIVEYLEREKPYMTTEQIKELINKGFEVAAHGTTHPYCGKTKFEQFEEEVLGSIQGIQDKLGVNVNMFSYPFGSRASKENEKLLLKKHKNKVRGLLGIKNKLSNKNPLTWERDLQETNLNIAAFRFFILPLIRKITH